MAAFCTVAESKAVKSFSIDKSIFAIYIPLLSKINKFYRIINFMINIGIISVSDRAFNKVYKDEGIPEIEKILSEDDDFSILNRQIIPDNKIIIQETLIKFCDEEKLDIVLTTGGTGPSSRDVTPDATLEIIDRVYPGFGEFMRLESLKYSKNAILSRQLAGTRGKTFVLNLPGNPKSIKEILPLIIDQLKHFIEKR
jgi:molybdopterin adenylyltransferase